MDPKLTVQERAILLQRLLPGLTLADQGPTSIGLALAAYLSNVKSPVVTGGAPPFIIDGSVPARILNGTGVLVLASALAGHVEGESLALLIQANTYTSIIPPDAPVLRGDTLDATKDLIVFMDRRFGRTIVTCLADQAVEAAAPAILSASVTGSSLTINFSKRVFGLDLTGFSLAFSAGIPKTLTGISSGLGTTAVVCSISSTIQPGDALNIIAGATNFQDLEGLHSLMPATVAVTNAAGSWNMPGATHMWRGDHATLAGVAPNQTVATVSDSVGSTAMTASATQPKLATTGAASRQGWEFLTNSYLKTAGGLAETMTSGAMFFVISVTDTVTQAAIMNAGETGSPASFEILARQLSGLRLDLDHGQSTPLTGGVVTTSVTAWLVTWDPTHREIYQNGSLVNSATGALAPDTTVDAWILGVLADLTTIPASVVDMKMYESRVGNQHLVAGDATNSQTYVAAYYA